MCFWSKTFSNKPPQNCKIYKADLWLCSELSHISLSISCAKIRGNSLLQLNRSVRNIYCAGRSRRWCSKKQDSKVLIYLDDFLMVTAFQETIQVCLNYRILWSPQDFRSTYGNKIGHNFPETVPSFSNRTKNPVILKGQTTITCTLAPCNYAVVFKSAGIISVFTSKDQPECFRHTVLHGTVHMAVYFAWNKAYRCRRCQWI